MPTLDTVFRDIRGAWPRAWAASGGGGSYNVTLIFASSTEDSAEGVSGVVGSTDAEQSFSFTAISPRTGLPRRLEISESDTLRLVVTYPADYDGEDYVYTDRSGTTHTGTFPVGGGTVNY